MIVVSDSSPLIILSKIACFPLLRDLFSVVYISGEVYNEVVVSGACLPGAQEVASAPWIEVKQVQKPEDLLAARAKHSLGLGELSSILMAQEMRADVLLLDDSSARRLALAAGLSVLGTVGFLEAAFRRGNLRDLREAFRKLLLHGYIDRRLLDLRLKRLGLDPLSRD